MLLLPSLVSIGIGVGIVVGSTTVLNMLLDRKIVRCLIWYDVLLLSFLFIVIAAVIVLLIVVMVDCDVM